VLFGACVIAGTPFLVAAGEIRDFNLLTVEYHLKAISVEYCFWA
jgi:hypothetical protein